MSDHSKIKLLLLCPTLLTGGAEKVMKMLAVNLNADLFDIHFAVLRNEADAVDQKFLDSISLIDLNAHKKTEIVKGIIGLVRSLKPDVVLSTIPNINLPLGLFKFLLPSKTKIIARESSIASVAKHNFNPLLYKLLYPIAFGNFDKIICQSNAMKNDLVDNFGLKEKKMKVVNNPLNTSQIDALKNKAASTFDIIQVANLSKHKGVERVVDIIKLLPPNLKLGVIGEGDYRATIQNSIEKNHLQERIKLLGFQQNPYAFVDKAKVIILTSFYEGFPNVLIEALYCGKPVIAYNVPGGIPEIIEDGLNGRLIKDGDNVAFSNAIVDLIQSDVDHKKISDRAYEKYNMNKIMEEYQATILSVNNGS